MSMEAYAGGIIVGVGRNHDTQNDHEKIAARSGHPPLGTAQKIK